MRLAILGATGGVGTHLLKSAVAAGHDVTAVVRRPEAVRGEVRTVTADFARPGPGLTEALHAAVGDVDAVVSALGPRSRAEAGVVSAGTSAVIDAMGAHGRLLVVSAAPVGTIATQRHPDRSAVDPDDGLLIRTVTRVLKRVLAAQYADLAAMEDVVTAHDGLDWTIVRPPRLTDGPRTDDYRVSADRNLRDGRSVSRADVAAFLLHAATGGDFVRKVVRIAT